MMNLMSLALVAWTGAQQPATVGAQPTPAVHAAPAPAPRLSAKQKAWFARAIDHILTDN